MGSLKNSKIEIQKSFVAKYKNEIFPCLKGHEVLRRRLHIKYMWLISLSASALVGFLIYTTVAMCKMNIPYWLNQCSAFIFTALIATVACSIIFRLKDEKSFFENLKSEWFPKILETFGKVNWSNNKKVIADNELEASQLFATFNIRTTDDEFCGTYNDIDFKVCETSLTYESGSGKNRTCINVFKGIVLKFQVDKNVNTHTMVSTKGDLTARDNKWIGIISVLSSIVFLFKGFIETGDCTHLIIPAIVILFFIGLLIWIFIKIGPDFFKFMLQGSDDKKMEKIILEDVKFGKKYHVYSQDQVEARVIVTPAFMEKFLNLKTAYGAKNAKCAFYGKTAMFAISTDKNLFEIGSLDKTLLAPETFKNLYNEIAAIYDIIDYFKLDK